ncbi:hypothetical protein FI667_g10826, partial [Globisporangium splendens]
MEVALGEPKARWCVKHQHLHADVTAEPAVSQEISCSVTLDEDNVVPNWLPFCLHLELPQKSASQAPQGDENSKKPTSDTDPTSPLLQKCVSEQRVVFRVFSRRDEVVQDTLLSEHKRTLRDYAAGTQSDDPGEDRSEAEKVGATRTHLQNAREQTWRTEGGRLVPHAADPRLLSRRRGHFTCLGAADAAPGGAGVPAVGRSGCRTLVRGCGVGGLDGDRDPNRALAAHQAARGRLPARSARPDAAVREHCVRDERQVAQAAREPRDRLCRQRDVRAPARRRVGRLGLGTDLGVPRLDLVLGHVTASQIRRVYRGMAPVHGFHPHGNDRVADGEWAADP